MNSVVSLVDQKVELMAGSLVESMVAYSDVLMAVWSADMMAVLMVAN